MSFNYQTRFKPGMTAEEYVAFVQQQIEAHDDELHMLWWSHASGWGKENGKPDNVVTECTEMAYLKIVLEGLLSIPASQHIFCLGPRTVRVFENIDDVSSVHMVEIRCNVFEETRILRSGRFQSLCRKIPIAVWHRGSYERRADIDEAFEAMCVLSARGVRKVGLTKDRYVFDISGQPGGDYDAWADQFEERLEELIVEEMASDAPRFGYKSFYPHVDEMRAAIAARKAGADLADGVPGFAHKSGSLYDKLSRPKRSKVRALIEAKLSAMDDEKMNRVRKALRKHRVGRIRGQSRIELRTLACQFRGDRLGLSNCETCTRRVATYACSRYDVCALRQPADSAKMVCKHCPDRTP